MRVSMDFGFFVLIIGAAVFVGFLIGRAVSR